MSIISGALILISFSVILMLNCVLAILAKVSPQMNMFVVGMQLLMRQIWQEEKPTVIFVTHDIEEAVFLSSKIYVLTQRPGTVKAEVPVLLPYDRDLSLKDTDEFIELRRKVNQLIEHESLS